MKLNICKIKYELSGHKVENIDTTIISIFCWTPHRNHSQQIVDKLLKAILKKEKS